MADVLLILHILAAATWFGANMVQFFVTPRMRTADNGAAAGWHRMTASLGRGLYTPAAILVLITGFGLIGTSDDAYGYADTFVLIGVVTVAIGAVLGMRVFVPLGEKAAAAYDADDRTGAESVVGRIARIAALDMLVLVVAFVAMILKWGAGA